jgi:hypothetical protein
MASRKSKIDYAELCDVLRIKVNAARAARVESARQGKGLTEPTTGVTDTGVRTGDPRAAEGRRVIELQGAALSGTVKVPVKGAKGRTRLEDAPASEGNVRAALEYWRTRKPRTEASRTAQNTNVSELARRLEAIMAAQELRYNESTRAFDVVHVADRGQHAMVDTAQAHRGPTLVKGRDTVPRLREAELSWDEGTDLRQDGTVRKSTTLDAPLGRERFDPKITRVPEPVPVLSRSQKKRLRIKKSRAAYVARLTAQGAR